MWRKYLPHMQARQTDNEETNTLSFVGSCFVLALSNYRPMASPRRWQTSCQSFGCYDMRWGRPRLEGQNCVSDLQGTIAVTTEAHVRIRGSLSWWVSGEPPSHTICHTHRTHLLSFSLTVGKYLRNVLSLLLVCERLVCFAFFELEWAN